MVRFVKMHGIGNDYVFVNGFEQRVDNPEQLAPQIADRHFGVGADGLILVLPPAPGVDAHVRMRMFNADGSEAQMCGNGIRCVCKLAHDHGICTAHPMRIQTGNGVLTLCYTVDMHGKVDQITVDMGRPRFKPDQIPVDLAGMQCIVDWPIDDVIRWPASLDANWTDRCGLDQRITCVSMGNPHVVLYCSHVESVPLATVGPLLETHALFPTRTNVHFVQVHTKDQITMRTWERGSGRTMACGTGASAVCVAGVLTRRSDRAIVAHLPGGDLSLHWRENDQHVLMTGPATEVFSGQWQA